MQECRKTPAKRRTHWEMDRKSRPAFSRDISGDGRKEERFMKRIFAAALSTMLLVLTFARCESAPAASPAISSEPSSETVISSAAPSALESSSSAPVPEKTRVEHEAPEPLPFHLATDPLPEENGVIGGGGGWKKTDYYCQDINDMFMFQNSVFRAATSNLSTLPVFRRNYPYQQFDEEPYETTEEMRESYRERVENFLTATGREDLLESGVEPDPYLWEEDEYPAYALTFEDLVIVSRAGYFSLSLSIPGLVDMDEEEIVALLQDNVYFREACALGGVTDPGVTLQREYGESDTEGRYATNHYTVFQRWDDPRENEISCAFAPIFMTATTLDDSIVFGVRTKEASEYLGDYDMVTPEQAAARLTEECGVQEDDILGYKLEYSGEICHGYYVPYYKFYYERGSEPKHVPEKESDVDDFPEPVSPDGLTTYCEYSIRAVQDAAEIQEF